jgi:hypothetical protein
MMWVSPNRHGYVIRTSRGVEKTNLDITGLCKGGRLPSGGAVYGFGVEPLSGTKKILMMGKRILLQVPHFLAAWPHFRPQHSSSRLETVS